MKGIEIFARNNNNNNKFLDLHGDEIENSFKPCINTVEAIENNSMKEKITLI